MVYYSKKGQRKIKLFSIKKILRKKDGLFFLDRLKSFYLNSLRVWIIQ